MANITEKPAQEARKYYIHTYGCQMNYSDTDRTKSLLEMIGYKPAKDMDSADFVLFNTCSVRQKAEDKVYGQLRKLEKERKHRPGLRVGITGCMARIPSTRNSEEKDKLLRKMKELDLIFPIKDLPKLPKLLAELDPDVIDNKVFLSSTENYFQINPKSDTKFQQFLPIMSGCDKFCTYCIVPYTRGREWSRSMEEVLTEAEKMVSEGAIEITLIGQNVNSYGITNFDKKKGNFDHSDVDLNPPFVQLLKEIDKLYEKGLRRIRFTSSNPWNFSKGLVYAIRDLKTLCPYVHLPLQSGSDTTLMRMNRSHTKAHYLEITSLLKKEVPGCRLSTDLIVGFCGETEEEFMETYDLFREVKWDMAYLAQYSVRQGTIASKLMKDDIPHEVKRRRWHMLNDLLGEISEEKHQAVVGTTIPVLVETYENGLNKGRGDTYVEVHIPSEEDYRGRIVDVKITEANKWFIQGEVVS